MRKALLIIILLTIWTFYAKAQYVEFPTTDLYDTDVMNMSLRAHAQMSNRIRNIMYEVQPLRTLQYQKYREGKYSDAINICIEARNKYVYYVVDNRAISDMEVLAADCACKIKNYELAIAFYNIAKEAGEQGVDNKLYSVFNTKLQDARYSYKNSDYRSLWDDVKIALKTGWENGECYFYQGVCYEKAANNSDGDKYKLAKKMYKLAKKKKYSPAITALKELKKKM